MNARFLTVFLLGSLFLALNVATSGCIGGAGIQSPQLPGGLGASAGNGGSGSGSGSSKGGDENDLDGDGNPDAPPPPPPGTGSGGSGGSGETGGGGGGGDGNVAKGTSNFQPFQNGMGEDKEPTPHEDHAENDPNGGNPESPGEQVVENQGCEPNCSGDSTSRLSRPADFNNNLLLNTNGLSVPVINGVNIHP